MELSEATSGLLLVENAYYIDVERVIPNPFQPRLLFSEDALNELADSITEHGVLQPILVTPHPDEKKARKQWFRIVSGERRWRAAVKAGLSHIPAMVRVLTDLEVRQLALQENIQRQSLTDYEEALGIQDLWQAMEDAGMVVNKSALGRSLKVSVTYITNRIEALGFEEDVKEVLKTQRNVLSSAKEINRVKDPDRRQKYLDMVRSGSSFAKVSSAIEADNTEIRLQEEANHAPDEETQQRQNLFEAGTGGGGGVSRGRIVTGGPTKSEAREQVTRGVGLIEAWCPYLSNADFEDLKTFARRLIRGDLSRGT